MYASPFYTQYFPPMINFDKRDPRNAWMMFFTNPGAMRQVYTPEEQANLKEVFDAVDAWELLDRQAHGFQKKG